MPQSVRPPANDTEVALQRVYLSNAAPVNGTTGAGVAPKGMLLIDYTNAILYINTGTQATPAWTKVGVQT